MALEIFRLVGSIFVDSEEANKSLAKTDEKAESVGKKFLSGAKTVGKWAAGFTAAAGVVVTGLGAITNSSTSTLDNIDKMSQKIGLSAEAYQEWSYVMGQNGMDVDKLQTGVKTLVTQMNSAVKGSRDSVGAFEELGVSIYDDTGALKSQEQMLRESLYALADMTDGTRKAQVANQLFGKSGSEMLPMLNQGSKAMQDLTDRAHELGLVVSDDAVKAGVALGDTFDDIKKSATAIGTKLGASLIPLFQRGADFIIANLPKIQALFEGLAPVVFMLLDGLLPPLIELAEQLFPSIVEILTAVLPIATQIVQAVLPAIVQLLQMILPPIVEIVQKLLPPLLALLEPILALLGPIIQLLQPILDLVVGLLDPLADLIDGLLNPLITIVAKLINSALGPLQTKLELLSGVISATFSAAIALAMSKINEIKGVLSGLIQFVKGVFTGDWKSAWDGVRKIFSSVFDGLKNSFKIPINWIIDGINAFIRGINKVKIPDWVPVVGGKGFSIKEIPRLAAGAVLEKGQTGFLEGNGAEAVVPLDQNRKWIHAVAEDMQSGGIGSSGKTETLLTAILDALNDLLATGIYLDKDKLVGSLAGPLDKKLGMIAAQKARA